MEKTKNIFILRHAETVKNKDFCIGGLQDSELTEHGKLSTTYIGKAFQSMNIHSGNSVIYSAQTQRCKETCLILPRKDFIIDTNIGPVDSGELNGRKVHDVIQEKNLQFRDGDIQWAFMSEKGDTFTSFKNRVEHFKNTVIDKEQNENIIIVTHGFTSRGLILLLKNMTISEDSISSLKTKRSTIYNFTLKNHKLHDFKEVSPIHEDFPLL